jgi:hypothetical protein
MNTLFQPETYKGIIYSRDIRSLEDNIKIVSGEIGFERTGLVKYHDVSVDWRIILKLSLGNRI